MNPWGTWNDWQRLEVDERVARYGRPRRSQRRLNRDLPADDDLGRKPSAEPSLNRDDVAACA